MNCFITDIDLIFSVQNVCMEMGIVFLFMPASGLFHVFDLFVLQMFVSREPSVGVVLGCQQVYKLRAVISLGSQALSLLVSCKCLASWEFTLIILGYLQSSIFHLENKWFLGVPIFNSCTIKKQTTKFSSANFQKLLRPSYIMLRIQRQEGKQCRSRWGGSFWATSSRSTLFANSAIFISGT